MDKASPIFCSVYLRRTTAVVSQSIRKEDFSVDSRSGGRANEGAPRKQQQPIARQRQKKVADIEKREANFDELLLQ